jgi:hypothetical protein
LGHSSESRQQRGFSASGIRASSAAPLGRCYPDAGGDARPDGAVKELLFYGVLAFALLRGLSWVRIPFAVRLWRRMRQFAFLYVGLIVVLAALTLVTGRTF